MECAIETGNSDRMDMLAEMLLLANTAMTNKEQMQYEGLRQYIDKVNVSQKKHPRILNHKSEIDQRAEELSKPLDET